ncbi:efflux RND transporter periplasmic adaptor subunit [Pseudomonas sp. GCM10022188]|uniref:efflux RND transporter periplasmic adaptor subunit n=1 Tax=Pseudomonas TaxID=286 RepID=UPI001E4B1A6A|nr:HlyD family efflux transporter periplasmic adaptor subunit [Pseudomonas oryzagri]MCC6075586.1 HlyD family efflux transporter periplasmic adaptor subunit [Pseudomonas oryzagri]
MTQAIHQTNPLATLLELGHRVRHAASGPELEFIAVNDTHQLVPYRQAALWSADKGIISLSGVVQVEANVPYAQWLTTVCRHLADGATPVARVEAASLPPEIAAEWSDWLPAHGLWLGHAAASGKGGEAGGLLLARDLPWSDSEVALLAEWADIWRHAWQSRQPAARWPWQRRRSASTDVPRRWWQSRALRWSAAALALAVVPVRLSVLAPGELVPSHPAVIRAPLEGVIDTFHVQPNQEVREGQPLFGFDEVLIQSRLEVARQSLATTETEYRQTMQQALLDPKSKAQLAVLTGKIEEKRAEAAFIADQLGRARVLAPRDGIALFDDPSEWIGRPVAVGERIMRIAPPGDIEVEAWVPLADAIPLPDGAPVNLYLNASPLDPVPAQLRYLAHDAVERPDGSYAYRLRARLSEPTEHRVGLKGSAKLRGRWVPLVYWVLRRPLASVRTTIGW